MTDVNIQKLAIILVTLLLVGFFGYSFFIKAPDTSNELLIVTVPTETELASQEILTLVEKLNAISIDKNIFSSTLFLGLKDFTQTITPETRGRANPFAAIGYDVPSTYTSSSTAGSVGR